MKPIRNLGRAVSAVLMQEVNEMIMHDDLGAFCAPSECYQDVQDGEEARGRTALRRAVAIAKAPWDEIVRQAKERAGLDLNSACPRYQSIICRLNARHNPFR